MQSKRRIIILIVAGVLLLSGVILFTVFFHRGGEYPGYKQQQRQNNFSKNLKDVNRFLVEKDNERIKSFISRRGWNMEKTETGLWYQIVKDQPGKTIEDDDQVIMNYEIRLLDGTLCYTSDSTGVKKFIVGRKETVMGLQEGIKFLSEGDRARLIIPPHLGHGLIGDEKRIPARAILVYTVHVLEVNQPETP